MCVRTDVVVKNIGRTFDGRYIQTRTETLASLHQDGFFDIPSYQRSLIGHTEPTAADPRTVRGDLGDDRYDQADVENRALRNIVYASEDQAAAERETRL